MRDVIAHYRILKKLGAGGMGEVYLAEDTKLNRKVAIKFLQPGSGGGDQSGRRLLHEARAAAKLDHPNICAIHEIGEDGGCSYIVMQYLEGETLDRLIAKQPLGVKQALAMGAEVADALSTAHAHGIIHRDIKPSNIIVTPRGQAKVMDFGLASLAPSVGDSDTETQSALTIPGAVAGTIPYMSPEQVRGEPVDPRSDIFSFGVTMYEAVSGQRPFSSESTAATISSILTQEPSPLARLRAELPDELQRIVRKCLEKDRDRRYQSAADLTVDLANLKRETESVSSAPGSGAGVTAVIRRTRRAHLMALASLAIIAVLGAWYLVPQFQSRNIPGMTIRSIAVLPFVNSSGDQNTEYLSDGITESIINAFSQLPALRVMARATVFRYKGKDVDPLRAGHELGVDAVVTGRLLQQGDTLVIQADLVRVSDGSQLWGDRFNRRMSDVLAVQEEMAKQITDRLRLRLTGEERQSVTKRYTESTEAYDLYLKGRYFFSKTTEESLDRSIAYYEQAVAVDPNYALAYVGLAQSYAVLGGVFGFRSPRETLPRGLGFAVKAVALDPTLADAHAALASYKLNYQWDWPGAEQETRQAIDLNPNSGASHHQYGSYLSTVGQFDRAIAERQLAQQLDPLSPLATANAGYPYYYAHRYDEALVHYRRAVDLDPKFPWSHLWIGQAYVQKGMYPEAIDAIDQAIRLSGGDTRPKATLGHAYGVAGRRVEALKVLDELKRRSAERYVSPYFLALIYVGLDDRDRALASLEAAYQERHPYLIFMKVEPVFDRLRSDVRFAELQKRVGLTEHPIQR